MIIFGFIRLNKLDKFINSEKYKKLISAYNFLIDRFYIEENNLLNKFGFISIDDLYKSDKILDSGVLKINKITATFGMDGFLVLGHIKESQDLIYTSLIINSNLRNKLIYKNNNKFDENGLLLSNLGINYDYRGIGYCSRIIKRVIRKCQDIYGHGIIYSEIIPTNLKSKKCHLTAGFILNNNLTNTYGDDVYNISF